MRPEALRNPIDTLALRAHTFFLASDALRGRETASPGARVAALYLVAQCRGLGLAPLPHAAYRLPVPLVRWELDTLASVFRVAEGGDTTAYRPGHDFVLVGGSLSGVRGFAGSIVWVGSSEEIEESPGALPPLKGRVAVTAGTLDRAAADTLAGRGAVGMVHLTDSPDAFRGFWTVRHDLLAVVDSVPLSLFGDLPAVVAAPGLSERILAMLRGHGGAVAARFAGRRIPVRGQNVACLLAGRNPAKRDTAIVLTAHYDHLGVGTPDTAGDSIYNGFSDDAAGDAMVLAIAKAIRDGRERALEHSLILLFFTGEEHGLLGSDYYVAHAPWPLARVLGVINLDAGAPPARVWSWRVAGGDGPLAQLAMDVAANRGWSVTTSPAKANSDYFPFARNGVPAIFPIPTSAPYEGLARDSSDALRRRWDHYHEPSDEWKPDFPFEGMGRYAEFAYLIVRALDRGLPADAR